MRKILLLVILFSFLVIAQKHLQNFRNSTIMKQAPSGKSSNIEGYASNWDNQYVYLLDEKNQEKKIFLTPQTLYLRTYINDEDKLFQQERIELKDFIKDQFISIDIFQENKESIPEALIMRQLIYVDEK